MADQITDTLMVQAAERIEELRSSRDRVIMASVKLGKWMSAALDDPSVCAEMKADIHEWFSAGEPMPEWAAPVCNEVAPDLLTRLRSSAKALRENTVYDSEGDACRLGVQADEFDEASSAIQSLRAALGGLLGLVQLLLSRDDLPVEVMEALANNHRVAAAREALLGESTKAHAATEVGRLINRILALAPEAGLYIGIKVEPSETQQPA